MPTSRVSHTLTCGVEGKSTKIGRDCLIFCFLLALMAGPFFFTNPLHIEAQGALGARILETIYVAKIYDGDTENLNFTVLNLERRDPSGASLFFFKVYGDGVIVVDEFSSPWECRPGRSTWHEIVVANLRGPDEYLMRAELYWKNQTTVVLEDVREFRVLVVKLYVAGWYQSISTVQLGARKPSTLTISFQNGGNDRMYSASVSLVDSSGLIVNPWTQTIGDVSPSETARTDFSVSVPSTASMGPHVLTFEISYSDFRGTSHVEKASITLTVTKLGANLKLDVPETVKYRYPIEAAVTLVDANGDPLPDQPVRFYILAGSEQTEIGTGLTDSSGQAKLAYSGTLNVGEYQVKALYEGSATYDSATTTTRIRILPIPTKLSSSIPETTVVGQSLNITAQLSDEMGNPVPGQVVEFYADNEKLGSSLTNEDGFASMQYVPGRKGSVQLRITYVGERNFEGAEWSGTLPIEGIRTTLTLFAQGFVIQGDNIVVKAMLKDLSGNPIESATLDFTVAAGSRRINQELVTDNEGIASISFEVISADTVKVEVVYSGDLRYEEDRANATVTVLSPLFLGGIVATIIGISLLSIIGLMKFKLGLDPFAWFSTRLRRRVSRPPRTKPVVGEVVIDHVGRCASCGAPISESENFCQRCGSRRSPEASDLDERVYSYILEHSGVISLKKAASELGITPEEVKASTERLKKAGRLE